MGRIQVVLRWWSEHWLLVAVFSLAIAGRVLLIPATIGADIGSCLIPWYTKTVAAGRWHSLGLEISNYSPPYMYLLALASALPVQPVTAIKLIPIVFDGFAAIGVHRLAKNVHSTGVVPVVAAAAFLLSPTPLINGAVWGQCDVIYTTFVVFALDAALRDRPLAAVLLLSVGVAFKQQALFFVPALGLLFMFRRR